MKTNKPARHEKWKGEKKELQEKKGSSKNKLHHWDKGRRRKTMHEEGKKKE